MPECWDEALRRISAQLTTPCPRPPVDTRPTQAHNRGGGATVAKALFAALGITGVSPERRE